ncbi:hypothetical protein GKE82_05195 [Conexibacter sp. W3-3-2]|uniref:FmdB family zinc ribbon protein n=1 Tax=Conexibacter sp. W3-3-2 TaxID=2675227 RepID=UPI0012B9B5D2|nr:hypothetical protein [Conexibacter sp. W3-3-2]
MPLYEYSCSCGAEVELLAAAGAAPPTCPRCAAGPMGRRWSRFTTRGPARKRSDFSAVPFERSVSSCSHRGGCGCRR